MWDDDEPALDRAIDDVARAMTAADAPPRITAHVLARIADGGSRRRLRLTWMLAPMAVAAAALVAVWIARAPSSARRPGARPAESPSARTAPEPTTRQGTQAPPPEHAIALAHRAAAHAPSEAQAETAGVEIADLTLASLALQPIDVNAIDVPLPRPPDPIAVTPIVTTPLGQESDVAQPDRLDR